MSVNFGASTSSDSHKRRIVRLLQVREQSKDIARKKRNSVTNERNKLLSLASESKQRDLANMKQNSLKTLKENVTNHLFTVGDSHIAVGDEKNAEEEWRVKKNHNFHTSKQLGIQAYKVLSEKKLQIEKLKNSSKGKGCLRKNQTLTKKSACIETKKCDNLDDNEKKLPKVNSSDEIIPNFISDKKINPNSKEPHESLNNDEEKVIIPATRHVKSLLCDCVLPSRAHSVSNTEGTSCNDFCIRSKERSQFEMNSDTTNFKSKPINTFSNYLKNRDLNQIDENMNENRQITNSDRTELKNYTYCNDFCNKSKEISQYENNWETANLKSKPPINTFSNYLKNRDLSQIDENRPITNSDMTELKNLIKHSRQLNSAHGECIISQPNFSKSAENILQYCNSKQSFMNVSNKNKTFAKSTRKENFVPYKLKKTKVQENDPRILNAKSKIQSISPSKLKWENASRKTIKSYDHPNRFVSDVLVNDQCVVHRLPKGDVDAFQNAIKEKDEIAKELVQMSLKEDKSKERGKQALTKTKINQDFKLLSKELDALTTEENINSWKQSENLLKENKNQQVLNDYVLTSFTIGHQENNDNPINGADFNSKTKSKIKNKLHLHHRTPTKSPLNVGTAVIESNKHYTHDVVSSFTSEKDDSSSIILKRNNDDVSIEKYDQHETNVKSDKNKFSNFQSSSEYINSEVSQNILYAKRKTKLRSHEQLMKSSKNARQNKKQSSDTRLAHSVSTSTTSSFSFDGLKIIIEVKKDKKTSAHILNKNDENIDSEKNQNFAKEIVESPKVFKKGDALKNNIPINKNINGTERNFDSSESTVYMSLPDQITTKFEEFYKNKLESPAAGKNNKLTKAADSLSVDKANLFHNGTFVEKNLRKFVIKLLEMSRNEVEKLEVDVSDVSTPSSSVMNISSNINRAHQDAFKEKIEYILEDVSSHINSGKNNREYLTKPSKSIIIDKIEKSASKKIIDYCSSSDLNPKKSKSEPNLLKHVQINKSPDVETSKNKDLSLEIVNDESDRVQSIPETKGESKNTNGLILNQDISEGTLENIENFHQLSEECSQRISYLLNVLNKIRKEKQKNLNSSISTDEISINSSEALPLRSKFTNDENSTTDTSFIPVLSDIPKPTNSGTTANIIDVSDSKDTLATTGFNFPPASIIKNNQNLKNKETHRNKPPAVLNPHSKIQNMDVTPVTPHELSTIIEIDTPNTIRNISLYSKNLEPSNTSMKSVSSKTSEDDISNKKRLLTRESKISHLKDDCDAVDVPKLEDSAEIKLKSFISLDEYMKKYNTTSGVNETIDKSSFTSDTTIDLNSEMFKNESVIPLRSNNSPIRNLTNPDLDKSSNKSVDRSPIEKLAKPMPQSKISENTSGIPKLTPFSSELESLLNSFGMNWAASTLKKTREAASLTGSTSISDDDLEMLKRSRTRVRPRKEKVLDSNDSSISLNSDFFSDQLVLENYTIEDLSKLSLEVLFENIENFVSDIKKNDPKRNNIVNTAGPSGVAGEAVKNNSGDAKRTSEICTVSAEIHSEDKTQQRTSTPVIGDIVSSKICSSSDGLFDDLSSVKNLSNSDKNASSDDRTLSVPDVSIKFRLLFDSSANDE